MRNIRISKAIIAYCLIGIVCAAIAGAIGWQYASTHLGELGAIVFFCIVGAFASVAVYGFGGLTHVWIGYKRVDLQVYKRDQLSLPYQQEASTKIVQQEREELPGRPLKKLPPKKLPGFLPLSSGKSNMLESGKSSAKMPVVSGNLPVESSGNSPVVSGNYIDSLPLDQRIANAYRRFPEKSNRELAQMCGCSHPMVGQWKKRNNVQ